ncbi:tetratricopeptide repeat protein [Belliella kenyensis]|uniref:Tetratricopeptide repeat protein n=1 Tax=Belliella kenyensis TaxID=1472724 RepID=A0ABV8EP20_9BACT|nr:tetratricopeptide repeat protein [Belliella kenyensis]MCH7400561.1 tetratricopeptide repeat protein [Belliella kenyensis]MDN3602152.1 tetratricopeptide repeat protein [Belliella kenyensis]
MRGTYKILIIFSLGLSSCFGTFSEGELHFRNGEYEEAISEFSKTLFLNVTDIKSLHLRARAYEELEKYADAYDDYKRILSIDPEYGQAHAGIGKLYWKLEDYRQAENHLLKAAKYDGDDFETIFLLGRTMLQNKNFKSADEFLGYAKDKNPKDPRVYFYQGMARSAIGDTFGAAGSFNMSLALDPDNLVTLYNLGIANMATGEFEWALEDFNQLLKKNPNHVDALARRGMCKKALNNPTACQDLMIAANRGSQIAKMNMDDC